MKAINPARVNPPHTYSPNYIQLKQYIHKLSSIYPFLWCYAEPFTVPMGLTASRQLHKSLTERSVMMVKSSASLWDPPGIIFTCLLKQSAHSSFSIGLQVNVSSKFTVIDVIYMP